MFKFKAKFDADSLLYLLSHCECDGHIVHMLTQRHLPSPVTSTVKLLLFMHIPVHSPWLPGYINVMQTVLIMLTMAGLFPTDFIQRVVGILKKEYNSCFQEVEGSQSHLKATFELDKEGRKGGREGEREERKD